MQTKGYDFIPELKHEVKTVHYNTLDLHHLIFNYDI